MANSLQAKDTKNAKPLMDVDLVQKDLLEWLAELRFPVSSGWYSWEDCVKLNYPTEEEEAAEQGHRIRISLTLQTKVNHYLILLIENLAPDSRGVYIASVHVKWRKEEWQMQRFTDASYRGEFADIPKARHTLWAQNFRMGELHDALNACAVAILSHELVPHEASGAPPSKPVHRPAGPTPLDLPGKKGQKDEPDPDDE
jgi:hypothetical protein